MTSEDDPADENGDEAPLDGLADELGGEGDDPAPEADDGGRRSTNDDGPVADRDAEAGGEDGPRIDRDAPLGDLAAEFAAAVEEDPPEDDPFDEVDVGGPVPEAEFEAGDSENEATTAATAVDDSAVASARNEHVVDKRAYCQRCEYFSEPPESTCTNQGTDIVEVVDAEHFRVRDCPKVDEDGFGSEDR